MGRPLVPELHDVGKLFHIEPQLASELGLEAGSAHSSDTMRRLPKSLGIPEPATNSWRGIVEHHVKDPTDLDIVLLRVADHAGASLARVYKREDIHEVAALHRTVHKLWNPGDQRELRLPGSGEELRALIEWLSTDPDQHALFQQHGSLLDARPEELKPPLNVTSLASHLTIVGKVYRFLMARAEFYAGTTAIGDIKDKAVDLVKAKITFPHSIVRTRDMALFDFMSDEMTRLAEDDKVLVSTFDEVLAILGPDEETACVFARLTDAGFRVIFERARVKISDLKSTPSSLRKIEVRKLKSELDSLARKPGVPESRREQVYEQRWEEIDREYPKGVLTARLPDRFAPPICDICQMERATRLWPEDPEALGPHENIGDRCYRLRQTAPRLFKLDRWTAEPSARVAWVYVGLDLDRLVEFLEPLYQQYAQDTGLSPELAGQVDVRPPLIAEFQKDYRRFLADFATSVEEWVGTDNVEHVGGEAGEAANTLLCVRLESVAQVPEILTRYLERVRRYFPVMLNQASAAGLTPVQPFRLAVSVSGVKFPFSEHWRIMQADMDDVLINVVGRRPVRAPLASLPILIEAGQSSRRAALHNLAEVAKVSESLAEVYAQNKGEKHYNEYQDLISKMRPLGMTYESLVAYANLLEG